MTILNVLLSSDADKVEMVVNTQVAMVNTGTLHDVEGPTKWFRNADYGMLIAVSGDMHVGYVVNEGVRLMAADHKSVADVFADVPGFLVDLWDYAKPCSDCTVVLAAPVNGAMVVKGYRLSATGCDVIELQPGQGIFQPGQLPELADVPAPGDMAGLVKLATLQRKHAGSLGALFAAGGSLDCLTLTADGFDVNTRGPEEWAPAEAPDPLRDARKLFGVRFGVTA